MTAVSGNDGYEGVTHAGIAVVAADTGRVLMAQRAPDPAIAVVEDAVAFGLATAGAAR